MAYGNLQAAYEADRRIAETVKFLLDMLLKNGQITQAEYDKYLAILGYKELCTLVYR